MAELEQRTRRSERLLNRELSWLEFNARVLELAEDEAVPLLERVKFCAIFSSNLDEFTMVRVAGQFAYWAAYPFRLLWRFFWRQKPIVKWITAAILAPFVIGHLHFFWHSAWIRGYDIDYVQRLGLDARAVPPAAVLPAGAAGEQSCGRSYLVDVAAGLIDFTVNRNLWMPSNPFSLQTLSPPTITDDRFAIVTERSRQQHAQPFEKVQSEIVGQWRT